MIIITPTNLPLSLLCHQDRRAGDTGQCKGLAKDHFWGKLKKFQGPMYVIFSLTAGLPPSLR
jgi:hypothetical protein